jgi:UDP-N-acetylmuramoylalanine--D-glutamate ligase
MNVFAGHRYAVLGLGRNGLPAALALRELGAAVVAWDDSPAARAEAATHGIALHDLTEAPFRFDALVLSPGIPHLLPAPHPVAARARAAGVPILSDAELLFRAVRAQGGTARFAGITGTNGKSTTTALLAHVLRAAGLRVAAGGNLGPAALALPRAGVDVYCLEMSSYMLERIATLRFDAACMLNLAADHLDRHGDMAGYAAAKRTIFARQQAGDVAVIGVDDAPSRQMHATLAGHPAPVVRVSGCGPADLGVTDGVLRDAHGPLADLRVVPALRGAHNAQNAAAAAAAALHLGVPRAAIGPAMAGFAGLPHRQQGVGRHAGVEFVNDSKATNADAAARALGTYRRVVWIAGGIAKAGGIDGLAPLFPRIAHAVLIGRDAPLLAATLRDHGVPHELAGDLEHAVPAAFRAARAADVPVVLLSPACASFDQFGGFEARGERFAALVANLSNGALAA